MVMRPCRMNTDRIAPSVRTVAAAPRDSVASGWSGLCGGRLKSSAFCKFHHKVGRPTYAACIFARQAALAATRIKLSLPAVSLLWLIFVPALMGVALSIALATAAAAKTKCANDPNLTLDEYLTLSEDHDNWHKDVFKRIPKGLKVVVASKRYILTKTVEQRVLPSNSAYVLALFRFNFEFTSPCRVQDPNGEWWLIYAFGNGFLTYVPASGAEEEK